MVLQLFRWPLKGPRKGVGEAMEPWHYYGFVTFSIPFLSMKMQKTKDSGTSIQKNGFRWF